MLSSKYYIVFRVTLESVYQKLCISKELFKLDCSFGIIASDLQKVFCLVTLMYSLYFVIFSFGCLDKVYYTFLQFSSLLSYYCLNEENKPHAIPEVK